MNCPFCNTYLPLSAAETHDCACNGKLPTFRCIPGINYWLWINTRSGCIGFNYDFNTHHWEILSRIEDEKGISIESHRIASGEGTILTKDAATLLKRYQKLLAFS